MATSEAVVSGESLNCVKCLKLCKNLVLIPCGHSCCMGCIKKCEDQQGCFSYNCSQCRQSFSPKTPLSENTILCEVVKDFKTHASSLVSAGDVTCDFCTDCKVNAVKSCQQCTASFCERHLAPHQENAAFGDHRLTDPVDYMNRKECTTHKAPLVFFCKTHNMCGCRTCGIMDHGAHEAVPVEEVIPEIKNEFLAKESASEKQIEVTEAQIGNCQQNVEFIISSSQRVKASIASKLTDLIKTIENTRTELIELVEIQEKEALEQENSIEKQLREKCTEVKNDQLQLQTSLNSSDTSELLQVKLKNEFKTLKVQGREIDLPNSTFALFVKLAAAENVVTKLSNHIEGKLKLSVIKKRIQEQGVVKPTFKFSSSSSTATNTGGSKPSSIFGSSASASNTSLLAAPVQTNTTAISFRVRNDSESTAPFSFDSTPSNSNTTSSVFAFRAPATTSNSTGSSSSSAFGLGSNSLAAANPPAFGTSQAPTFGQSTNQPPAAFGSSTAPTYSFLTDCPPSTFSSQSTSSQPSPFVNQLRSIGFTSSSTSIQSICPTYSSNSFQFGTSGIGNSFNINATNSSNNVFKFNVGSSSTGAPQQLGPTGNFPLNQAPAFSPGAVGTNLFSASSGEHSTVAGRRIKTVIRRKK
ncbi:tripartite motif-containing protein 29 [Callorhinchus milii]|uniref:tripartite motif-containing protein 29 n=1 Tax=Callorhinchus milii TaxID=7868 RepID=UPI0004572E9A|nr:tripartite motif-containing protein 29 [Callorhinchus milii]|eukprot:gi/632969879/ref/XP_007901333.1/ PREDICTED: tripartite motif-containing protein 29-like [Callorhinchus milii]